MIYFVIFLIFSPKLSSVTAPVLRVVCVVMLLVLAGCGSYGTDDNSPTRDPYTVDEMVTSTDEPQQLVPGVTNEGLENPETLVNSHAKTLANASYILERNFTATYPNGTIAADIQTEYRIAPGGTPAYARTYGTARAESQSSIVSEGWFTENETYLRWTENDTVEYEHRQPNETYSPADGAVDWIADLLADAENVSMGINRGNVTRYVLDGECNWDVQCTSFTMVVHEAGYVEAYRSVATRTLENKTREEVESVSFTRINDPNLTVEQPDWYEDAVAKTQSGGTPQNNTNQTRAINPNRSIVSTRISSVA